MNGIADWIDKRARITPERIALIGEQRQLTYREMSAEVNRLARLLQDRHQVKAGERIAILAGNSIDYFLLLFAIAKLGGIAVVLNIRLTPGELEYQLNDSGARLLIAERTYRREGEQFLSTTAVKEILWFDQDEQSAWYLPRQTAAYAGDVLTAEGADGASPFVICYTSGTTGRPKGAVLTQENMFWNAVNNVLALDLTSADKVLTLLPMFHIGGIGLFALPALFVGATVLVPNRFDPDQALQWIEQRGATVVMGVPTIHDLIRKSKNFQTSDLRSVRWFYTGGAPCPAELFQAFWERGLPFAQGFGMTEASPTIFMTPPEDYNRKIGSVGKPVMFCDVRIVDEQGKDVAPGEIGELAIKGGNIMQGYWNRPDANRETFRDGWLLTGDLAYQDEEGFFYIAGRKKDMIISGGENIYPLEVEQVIRQLPGVDEAAVIGVAHPKWGEVPAAVIAMRPGETLSEEAVKSHCQKHLAKYKVPAHVRFVSALPKNATGKIDKKRIKDEFMKEETHGQV